MSADSEQQTVALSHTQLVGLLVFLKRYETELDDVQQEVCERISMKLFEQLSIEEMQQIEGYYAELGTFGK